MDLELSADQVELGTVATQVLDRYAPLSLARALLDGDGDDTNLGQAIADLGWYAVGLDDDPFGVPGLALLAQAVGAHVASLPLVDTAVGARLAAAAMKPSDLGSRLAAGDVTAALCLLERGADWTMDGVSTRAEADAGGLLLTGEKFAVEHGAKADVLIVVAERDDDVGFCLVAPDAPGVLVTPQPSLDPAVATATVTFDRVRLEPGDAQFGAEAQATLRRALALGAVASAAEGQGAASAGLDMAIAYAKERVQFGQPIGRFQALQQLMADAHVLRESTWSTILYASAALDEDADDALEAASIAKAYASRSTRKTIEIALQVFGGVAFTWEHDVHLFQRRVLTCERRYGDTIHHERILAELLSAGRLEVVA